MVSKEEAVESVRQAIVQKGSRVGDLRGAEKVTREGRAFWFVSFESAGSEEFAGLPPVLAEVSVDDGNVELIKTL